MGHSRFYEEESDQDDYKKLKLEFHSCDQLEAVRNAPGSEDGREDGSGEDGGGGKSGEASLAPNTESNKAGSAAPEIGMAGADLGSENGKEGGKNKKQKKTRTARRDKKEEEIAFSMATTVAAAMASNEDDPMHQQDPLRGDYLEHTGTRERLTPLWRCGVACATSSSNMTFSEDFNGSIAFSSSNV